MRLAAKLTIAFGAVTLVPLVPLTLVAREVIANRYRQELRRSLDEEVVATDRDYAAAARDVERAVARLARVDDAFGRSLRRAIAALERGELDDDARAALSDEAQREAQARGLDVLLALGPGGEVLAAPGDPGREGAVDEPLLVRVRTSGPRARVVEERPRFVHNGPGRLAVEAARELVVETSPRRTVWILAGAWLDEALPERSGQTVERRLRPAVPPPPDAIVRRVELDAGPERPAVVVELWALDRSLRAALSELTVGAAALALGGALLALVAGALVARRISARLARLAEGADAVARGRRDLAVPIAGSDEVAGLTRHFNGMVGALALAEETAVRAERVAAWREMAQHLAHELKNPLTPIQMSVETLQRMRARPERAEDFDRAFAESSKVILDEVARLKHIVSEFSRFARLPAPVLGPVDVRELCAAAARLYDGATPIACELEDGLPRARADRDQLQQVLVNLLENAREAVQGAPSPRILLRASRRGDRVAIEVRDNGPGIAEAMRARLFLPYATGKVGGTGLGLALVHRIVSEHGGRITVEDGLPREGGAGAGFLVELPVAGPAS